MDSFKFHDIRLEKANAISKHRKIQRIATLFRFIELFVFIIVISRCFITQFAFSFKLLSTDYFRDFSSALISPKFVFVIGNLIVIALLLLSGRFSAAKIDYYDEYVESCRKNHQHSQIGEEKTESDRIGIEIEIKNKHKHNRNEPNEKMIKMSRSQSGNNLERSHLHDRRRKLRRSMTERCKRSTVETNRKISPASDGSAYAEDELSSEEFRRTVEAFIERQQRSLREEEEGFSAAVVVSFEKK